MININKVLPEENELTDFEKMIMKWTAFDHYCPSIKAEVIWDMMLSEFIADMVAYAYRDKEGKQYTADHFYLLAKEFPIKSEEKEKKNPFSSSKVDYLVAFEAEDDKKVILVELKTTPGSFNKKQQKLYEKCDAEKLFEFYDELINEKVTSKRFKEPLKWEGSEKYTSQIIYMFHQFKQFQERKGDMKESLECINQNTKHKFHSSFIKTLYDRYKTVELFYLYVDRVKDSIDKGYYLTVQMERVQSPNLNDKNVNSEQKDDDNKKFVIYDSKKKKSPDEFMKIIDGKSVHNDSNAGVDKITAWETFCKLIDAVNNYKTDFEETKKEYESYHRN